MALVQRHSGFVVGHTNTRHGGYWTVRVKEEGNPQNGKKFDVMSIADEVKLASGLNVTFLIGTVDGPQGQKIEKAVDVQLA